MKRQSVVLVTGASSGIGRAISELLAREGMRVFGSSRSPDRVTPAAGVEYVRLDVDSEESVQACVGEVVKRAGPIDVLINNAGYELGGRLKKQPLKKLEPSSTRISSVWRAWSKPSCLPCVNAAVGTSLT